MKSSWVILFASVALAQGEPRFQDALKRLNVAPSPAKGSPSPFTHPIDEDLMKVYALEADAAFRKVDPKLGPTAKSRRLHEILAAKNDLVRETLDRTSDGKDAASTAPIAQRVFKILSSNAVSKIDSTDHYDRRGDVGFCFGRAALVHYLLLENGVPQDRIAKIFVLGQLTYQGRLWEFHMATLFKGAKGQWWVIDSLFDRPLPHREWMEKATAFDINPSASQLRFYVTDARKFQPAFGQYRAEYFEIPELKQYFSDLFRSLKK